MYLLIWHKHGTPSHIRTHGTHAQEKHSCKQKCLTALSIRLAVARYWRLELNGVKVAQRNVTQLNSHSVILDSGASLIFASDEDAAAINQVPPRIHCMLLQTHKVHCIHCKVCILLKVLNASEGLSMEKSGKMVLLNASTLHIPRMAHKMAGQAGHFVSNGLRVAPSSTCEWVPTRI